MLARDDYINWILTMRKTDPDYARAALLWYAELMPWADLVAGVREVMKEPT